MTMQIFQVRRDILIPFGIGAVLLLCLLVLSLLGKGSAPERIFLAAVTPMAAAFFLMARDRRITITDRGIAVRKFFRTKEVGREEINHVGAVILRKKVYLLLNTSRGFIILSNAYGNFSGLVRAVVGLAAPEKVEEEVRMQTEQPVQNRSDAVALWVAVVVIAGLVILKLSSV